MKSYKIVLATSAICICTQAISMEQPTSFTEKTKRALRYGMDILVPGSYAASVANRNPDIFIPRTTLYHRLANYAAITLSPRPATAIAVRCVLNFIGDMVDGPNERQREYAQRHKV